MVQIKQCNFIMLKKDLSTRRWRRRFLAGSLRMAFMVLLCAGAGMLAVPSTALAATYSAGDACSAAGAKHENNDASGFYFLICNGTTWQPALTFDAGGNSLRIDNDPATGSAGCFRYNGASGRIQYSDDCSSYLDLTGAGLWQPGGGGDIYYNSAVPAVGIGTSAPAYMLDVNGDVHIGGQLIVDGDGGVAAPTYMGLGDLDDVDTTGAANGNVLQFDGANWVPGAGGGGGDIRLQSGSNIFYSSGNVGIGTNAPTAELSVVGDILFTGTITDISDRRLKENIMPLSDSLKGVTSLNGYSFTMKSDPTHATEYGLMAQEVETVFPPLVKTDPEGTKSLNYMGMIAPMVEAMKQQQALIEQQGQTIEALQKRIEALEQRNDSR